MQSESYANQLRHWLDRAREKSSLGDEILVLMNQTGKFPLTSPGSGPTAKGMTTHSSKSLHLSKSSPVTLLESPLALQ